MRLRNITGSREVIAESPYVVPEDTLEACPGTWHEIFGNDHPIHIEIGMGKGRFLNTLAKQNPQIKIFQRIAPRDPENGRGRASQPEIHPYGCRRHR